MSGASSRRKGHDWEREVARMLRDATGFDYQRVLTETRDGNSGDVAIASRPTVNPVPVAAIHRTGRGGERLAVMSMADFERITRLLRGQADFVVQCKRGARPDIYGAVKQATEAA